jgi:DNA-binding CsgD family transcriptional regulator
MRTFEEALVMSQNLGRTPQVIETLEGMASLAGAVGHASRAARLWGAAKAAREATGIIAFSPGEMALHEPYLAAARSRLGEAEWEEGLAEGRAKSLEEAAAYALSKEEQPAARTATVAEESSPYPPSVALTPREKEVALLVAQELSNRQIASALTLSEHTVATHLRNVLKKLGLHSRDQVAAWVREHQLLS